jgi:hypothetical protein
VLPLRNSNTIQTFSGRHGNEAFLACVSVRIRTPEMHEEIGELVLSHKPFGRNVHAAILSSIPATIGSYKFGNHCSSDKNHSTVRNS